MEDKLNVEYTAQKPIWDQLAQTASKPVCYPVTKLDCNICSYYRAGG